MVNILLYKKITLLTSSVIPKHNNNNMTINHQISKKIQTKTTAKSNQKTKTQVIYKMIKIPLINMVQN